MGDYMFMLSFNNNSHFSAETDFINLLTLLTSAWSSPAAGGPRTILTTGHQGGPQIVRQRWSRPLTTAHFMLTQDYVVDFFAVVTNYHLFGGLK